MGQDCRAFAAGCHCGAVRFQAELPDGLDQVVRCTCSYCSMRGSVMAFTELAKLRFVSGADMLSVYQFNTEAARHYFCRVCGIHTHHQRRLDPSQFAINVACLDGIGPYDFEAVPVVDGANHPLDHGGGPLRVVGTLRFESAQEAAWRGRNARPPALQPSGPASRLRAPPPGRRPSR